MLFNIENINELSVFIADFSINNEDGVIINITKKELSYRISESIKSYIINQVEKELN